MLTQAWQITTAEQVIRNEPGSVSDNLSENDELTFIVVSDPAFTRAAAGASIAGGFLRSFDTRNLLYFLAGQTGKVYRNVAEVMRLRQ